MVTMVISVLTKYQLTNTAKVKTSPYKRVIQTNKLSNICSFTLDKSHLIFRVRCFSERKVCQLDPCINKNYNTSNSLKPIVCPSVGSYVRPAKSLGPEGR